MASETPLRVAAPAVESEVQLPTFDPMKPMIVSAWGRKGSGKSTFNRRLFRSYPFDKLAIDVNGDAAHPLFTWLKESKGGLLGDKIKWNFTKFLIGRDGQVIERYAPQTEPEKLVGDIEAAL